MTPAEPGSPPRAPSPPRVLWWIIWAAILAGSVLLYILFGRVTRPTAGPDGMAVVGLLPLVLSMVVRWIVFPRFTQATRAFPIFVIGLALAEGSTVLGTFLGGEHRDVVAVLGLVGVLLWAPIYSGQFARPEESQTSRFR